MIFVLACVLPADHAAVLAVISGHTACVFATPHTQKSRYKCCYRHDPQRSCHTLFTLPKLAPPQVPKRKEQGQHDSKTERARSRAARHNDCGCRDHAHTPRSAVQTTMHMVSPLYGQRGHAAGCWVVGWVVCLSRDGSVLLRATSRLRDPLLCCDLGEVDHTLAVAPLVVVPGNNL